MLPCPLSLPPCAVFVGTVTVKSGCCSFAFEEVTTNGASTATRRRRSAIITTAIGTFDDNGSDTPALTPPATPFLRLLCALSARLKDAA